MEKVVLLIIGAIALYYVFGRLFRQQTGCSCSGCNKADCKSRK